MLTVHECIERWLDAKRGVLRETTWLDYREKADRYVLPRLGCRATSSVTRADLEGLYRDLARDGLSARSVWYAHAILRPALDFACRMGVIAANPARSARPSPYRNGERPYLVPGQLARFLVVAGLDDLAALWYLIGSAGLLPSEAVALRWDRIDLPGRRATVDSTLRSMGRGRWASFAVPARRRREVPLSEGTRAVLLRHRARQQAELTESGKNWCQGNLVFTEPNGAPLRWKRAVQGPFKALLSRAGLRYVPAYTLRYSCIELLLANGLTPEAVALRLGYARLPRPSSHRDAHFKAVERLHDDADGPALRRDLEVKRAGRSPALLATRDS